MESAWEVIDELDREEMESWDERLMAALKGRPEETLEPEVRLWMADRRLFLELERFQPWL